MKLLCALRLHDVFSGRGGEVGRKAITVLGGTAVCEEHVPYTHDSNLVSFMSMKQREHREANR